jgi:phage major head subunit gpT-like protein
MIIRQAQLDAAFYAFDLRFKNAFQQAPTWWDRLAMQVTSTGGENRYPWVVEVSGMREWVGERVIESLTTRIFSLPNKDFEKTIKIPRNAVLDDQLGLFGPQVDQLAYAAKKWPDDLLATAIQAGTGAAAVTFDGQPFFSANHPVNPDNVASPVQSNNFVNTALTAGNYDLVRSTMGTYVGETGRSLGVGGNLLVVPPQLRRAAMEITQSETVLTVQGAAFAAISNVNAGTATVLEVKELSNRPTEWYLFDVSRPIKPFIFQLRQAPQFQSLDNATDRNRFLHKELIYGCDSRGNAGYGAWFLGARATAAGV